MTDIDLTTRSRVVPIYVIAGFLGSGKTALLKRILAHQLDRDIRPAVLMNEFGEVDVDGTLLSEHPRSHDVELQSLLSGCICCDLSEEFVGKVRHLLKESQGGPLFIETTGLADTGQVVQSVEQALVDHQDQGRLASVIVVVDAPRFLTLGSYWSQAEDHLKQADTVVLNKLDLIDERQAAQVERRVRSINPIARLARAVGADVPVDWLLAGPRNKPRSASQGTTTRDSTAGYRSGSFKILRPIDLNRFERWLKRYQRSVVRLKGYVKVNGCPGLQEVQWTLGRLSVTPYRGVNQSYATIVVIGRRVPWEQFLDGLEDCLVKPARQTKRWSKTRKRKP
ncbi:MAG: GTP-binding protein [Nitrospira sp.]|nr:GTP-binding protein [Nitrospira sp.]MCP9442129.1 GTP-binding protein [Nitrospira sp.]